jgi:hypothetical protein
MQGMAGRSQPQFAVWCRAHDANFGERFSCSREVLEIGSASVAFHRWWRWIATTPRAGRGGAANGGRPYWERMDSVWDRALEALEKAQEQGVSYVLFTHGWSTSSPGKTTARSQVRKLMRSPTATPYILRSECIQHESVFVAAIRPKPAASGHQPAESRLETCEMISEPA